jgi:hypothetical protein
MAVLVMQKSPLSQMILRRSLLGVIAASCCPVTSAWAVEGDLLRPFVNISMGYDSNLFRFANAAEAADVGRDPDSALFGVTAIDALTYQRYGAGIDMDLKTGRQQIRARVAADKTFFSKFAKLLDYAGKEMNAEWKWQVGNHWSGQLLTAQKRILAPYTDNTNNTIESNLRTDAQQVFQAEYGFHPDWRARARLSQATTDYSAQKSRDNTRNSVLFGLYRLGQTIESLGVEISTTHGAYASNGARDYREQGLRFLGIWNYSGKTRLNGHLGYRQRNRDHQSENDFSGAEWQFEARWQPTGKTQFAAAYYRELRADNEINSDYEVVDGVKLTAIWLVMPKTRLISEISREHFDYQGLLHKEKQNNISLTASYAAWAGGDISAGVKLIKRESPEALREYSSNFVFISANLKF